jgi:putative phosphoesterase
MKIGILSDAHGNDSGLSSAIRFLKKNGVKKIFFLGDAVGYIVNPNAVLNLLQVNNCQCLLGNHDAMLLGYINRMKVKEKIYKIDESMAEIKDKHRFYMLDWKPFLEKKFNGKRVLFIHGSPYDPLQGYVYPDTDVSGWIRLPYDLIFTGHSHYSFVKKIGRLTIVNVGSCGLPRDVGNSVTCAIYDTDTHKVNISRVLIDEERVIACFGNKMHPSVRRCLKR